MSLCVLLSVSLAARDVSGVALTHSRVECSGVECSVSQRVLLTRLILNPHVMSIYLSLSLCVRSRPRVVPPPGQLALPAMFARAANANAAAAGATDKADRPKTTPSPAQAAAAATGGIDRAALRAKIVNRTDKSEFQLHLTSKDTAYLQYAYAPARHRTSADEMVLDLTHTSVPRALQGQGIAGMLVTHAFEFAATQSIKVRPTCTYIHDFINKNPKYRQMIEGNTPQRATHMAGAATAHTPPAAAHPPALTRAPHTNTQNDKPPSSATLHPPTRNAREADERAGDKRRSPSSERDDGRIKKLKLSDSNSAPAAASSSSPSAIPSKPVGSGGPAAHVPLPFSSIFAKKWSNCVAAVSQAQEVLKEFHTKTTHNVSRASTSEIVDEIVDLMRGITLSKKEIDTRSIGMKYFFDIYIDDMTRLTYLRHTVPFLLDLIRDLPTRFDPDRPENSNLKSNPLGRIPILSAQHEASVHLTKLQIVSLLACSFFGLQAEHQPIARAGEMPQKKFKSANFDGLWLNIGRQIRRHRETRDTPDEIRSDNQTEVEKLKCIMQYFEVMRARVEQASDAAHPNSSLAARTLAGIVTFHRKVLKLTMSDLESRLTSPSSPASAQRVSTDTDLRSAGTIEDDGYGTLQIDFANCMIGGGILTGGCIQEEIRLTINTECLISILFTERMAVNESVTIIGAERFTNYTGYSSSFQYAGPHIDPTPVDPVLNRMKTVIVAIDAIAFRRKADQYQKENILREILKAYAGFALEDSVLGVGARSDTAGTAAVDANTITSYVPPTHQNKADSQPTAPTPPAAAAPNHAATNEDYSFKIISTGNWVRSNLFDTARA